MVILPPQHERARERKWNTTGRRAKCLHPPMKRMPSAIITLHAATVALCSYDTHCMEGREMEAKRGGGRGGEGGGGDGRGSTKL